MHVSAARETWHGSESYDANVACFTRQGIDLQYRFLLDNGSQLQETNAVDWVTE